MSSFAVSALVLSVVSTLQLRFQSQHASDGCPRHAVVKREPREHLPAGHLSLSSRYCRLCLCEICQLARHPPLDMASTRYTNILLRSSASLFRRPGHIQHTAPPHSRQKCIQCGLSVTEGVGRSIRCSDDTRPYTDNSGTSSIRHRHPSASSTSSFDNTVDADCQCANRKPRCGFRRQEGLQAILEHTRSGRKADFLWAQVAHINTSYTT